MEYQNGIERVRCTACGRLSPPVDSSFTLFTAEHGWRLERRQTALGFQLAWYCAPCFRGRRSTTLPSLRPVTTRG